MMKMRVYEVARDLSIDPKALVALFQAVGHSDVKNHMSSVPPEAVERIKRQLEKQTAQKGVEERIRPTVVKRKATSKAAEPPPAEPVSAPGPVSRTRPVPSERVSVVEPSLPSLPLPSAPPKSAPSASPAALPSRPAASPEPLRSSPISAPAPLPSPPPPASSPAAAPPPPSIPVELQPAPPPPSVAPMAAAAPAPAAAPAAPAPQPNRPSSPPRTGIDVWEGRPGVPMPQPPRGSPTPRRVQYDAKVNVGTGGRPRTSGPMMGPRMRSRGIGSLARAKGTGQPVTQERSAHKKVVRIEESVGLQSLAGKIQVKATEVLMKLMRLGMTGVNINSTLDAETAKIVANEFGWEVEDVAVSEADAITAARGDEVEEEATDRSLRPPVVTVMGHVDHGKTSLLDKIRKANVVAGEAGGITQHVGAYSVETARGPITFIDTPGHEAFTAMRARGAQTTDVVVLVVAADDGVMPQTKEAVNHARAANVPIVVAVNKVDKPDADTERVRRALGDLGLVPEQWGGETLYADVSALTGKGIDNLLEQIALQAEVLELKANPKKPATGVVLEAELDRGRGPVATILIQDGTLQRGDVILAGSAVGKVRAMLDSLGRNANSAGPATPVSIVGLDSVPSAGDPVHALKDLKKAQELAEGRRSKERRSLMPATTGPRMTLEEIAAMMSQLDKLELKLIIKADVQGSVEAVSDALTKLSTEKVKVIVVHAGVGAITEGDVNLALAAGGIIIGFNVRPAGKAASLAQQEKIEIRQYNIIYNVVDDVKKAMEGLLAPQLVEKTIGRAEVRQVFKISKAGMVAGSMVTQGSVKRSANVRLLRDNSVVWTGKISSLKRFKDDAREVKEGFDCGISLEGYQEVKPGDVFEVFEVESIKQTL